MGKCINFIYNYNYYIIPVFIPKNILNLKGFNITNKEEYVVTLLISDSYDNRGVLDGAVERLNKMYLRDEKDRLVRVRLQETPCHPEVKPKDLKTS